MTELVVIEDTDVLLVQGDEDMQVLFIEEDSMLLNIGEQGKDGLNIPTGGTTGQVLKKTSDVDYAADWEDQTPGTPAGGTAGQLLAKSSDTDFDDEWIDAPESLPAGGTAGQILTKQSNTDGDAAWEDPAVTGATAADKADLMAFAAAYG